MAYVPMPFIPEQFKMCPLNDFQNKVVNHMDTQPPHSLLFVHDNVHNGLGKSKLSGMYHCAGKGIIIWPIMSAANAKRFALEELAKCDPALPYYMFCDLAFCERSKIQQTKFCRVLLELLDEFPHLNLHACMFSREGLLISDLSLLSRTTVFTAV